MLEARVESFLEHKRCAQRDFKEEREVRTAMLKMSALDQKFLDKVISIIEHNMKKAIDIDVNTIAREVGMSKSSFYRKDKAYHGSFARRVCEKYPAEACIRTFRKGGDVIGVRCLFHRIFQCEVFFHLF